MKDDDCPPTAALGMSTPDKQFLQYIDSSKPQAEPITIAYWEWRPLHSTPANPGEPVLALHGLADHGGVWAGVAAQMMQRSGDRYHWLAPDLRGHGDSSKPLQGYDAPAIIPDLEALLAHHQWESAHVVAHSWAAKLAIAWASQSPRRIRSLTLVDPAFVVRLPRWMRLSFPLLYRSLSFLKLLNPQPTQAALTEVAQGLRQFQGWSDLQQRVFAQGVEAQINGQWASKFTPAARNAIFEDCLASSGFSQPLGVRSLFIQPDHGLNRSALQLRPYRRYLTALTLKSVPGNHWPHLTDPAPLAEVLHPFLSSGPAALDR